MYASVVTTVVSPAPAARAPSLSPRALARVRDYVDAHLRDAIRLEDLAAAACISRFHFARLFRASTGASPMQYVRHARVTAAKAMLAQSDPSIAEVAAELGFFDHSHFTRTFRSVTGVSPGQYRTSGP